MNIATYFPHFKDIDELISSDLSTKYDKQINTNIALHSEALDSIFSGEYFEELPLSFQTIYTTDPNPSGWYQQERINASKGYISDSGELYREHCSENDTTFCNQNESLEISLENIANTATFYRRTSAFINDNASLDDSINSGSLQVTAVDDRSWRNNSENWEDMNNRNRECQTNNEITFRDNDGNEYQYSSYSQGYSTADCNLVRHYYYPLSIVSSFSPEGESLQISYYMPDIVRTGILSDPPYDFIKQQLTLDPTNVINSISLLPLEFNQVQNIRRMFNGEDYALLQFYKTPQLTYQFEFGTNPRNDFFNVRECFVDGCVTLNSLHGQAARKAMFDTLSNDTGWEQSAGTAPPKSHVLGRLSESYIEIIDYDQNTGESLSYDVYPSYDSEDKTLDLSLHAAEIDLENIQSFLIDGIGDTPLDAKIFFNPDDSITGTMPIKLSLYQGNDKTADQNEDYMTIEFELDVSATTNGLRFLLPENQEIYAEYIAGTTIISRTVYNGDEDSILVKDGLLSQPETLNVKLLGLLSKFSDVIDGLENFFADGQQYFFEVELGDSFSIIDYYRNTVDTIKGVFTTKSEPTNGFFVRDIRLNEGESKNICFTRPPVGNLSASSITLDFLPQDRPGRGGIEDDFSLSSNEINFEEGETESCITFHASIDVAFDWVHEIHLSISQPTNGQPISRDSVKIQIVDSFGGSNRISGSLK